MIKNTNLEIYMIKQKINNIDSKYVNSQILYCVK